MGTFTNIGTIEIVTSDLFFMFSCQRNINITHLLICFDNNVFNILWKHV
jgi:hypothetical protein